MPRSNEPRSNEPRSGEPPSGGPGLRFPGCEDVLDRLDLYLDGLDGSDGAEEGLDGLPEDERTGVESHLSRCPSCARELGRARRVRDQLRALPREPFETPFETGLAESASVPVWQRASAPWLRWAVPAAVALGLGIALLVVLPWLRAGGPRGTGPSLAAQGSATGAPQEISPEQLARAELEARYALARLAQATRRARRELEQDVLARHVLVPVQQTLQRSLTVPPEVTPGDHQNPGRSPAPTTERPRSL